MEAHGRGDLGAAREHYEDALADHPKFVEAMTNRAIVFKQLGDSQTAASILRRAISITPRFAQAHDALAGVLKKQYDISGAIDSYINSIAADPTNPRAHTK